jgi:hypothetical protein
MGTVEYIHVAEAPGAPMERLDGALALKGIGLAGDRYAVGAGFWSDYKVSRDLTLIESEAIEELERLTGVALGPGEARRDVTTRGVELNRLLGHPFWVGDALSRGTHRSPVAHTFASPVATSKS